MSPNDGLQSLQPAIFSIWPHRGPWMLLASC